LGELGEGVNEKDENEKLVSSLRHSFEEQKNLNENITYVSEESINLLVLNFDESEPDFLSLFSSSGK